MRIFIYIILFIFSANICAELLVIVNVDNDTNSISKQHVQEIFMGRTRSYPNGDFALPLDQPKLRADFYTILTGRPIEQINAYWARIMFSGQASPPMMLPNEQAVIKTVSENKGAIGYINSKSSNTERVRVLTTLD